MLLKFPTTILVQFISSWLSLDIFCLLDSALCCHTSRNILDEKVGGNKLIFSFAVEKLTLGPSSLQWLLKTGLSVNKLVLKWRRDFYDASKISTFFSKVKVIVLQEKNKFIINNNLLLELMALCYMSLESLSVFNASRVTEKGWISIFSTCRKLKTFSITDSKNFNDKCLLKLAQCCADLESLELFGVDGSVSSYGLILFSKFCSKLQKLTIHDSTSIYCNSICDGIIGFLNNVSNLNALDFDYSTGLSLKLCTRLTTNAINLTDLNLPSLHMGNQIYNILYSCKLLAKFSTCSCIDISNIIVFSEHFNNCTTVNKNYVCEHLTTLKITHSTFVKVDSTNNHVQNRLFGSLFPHLTYLDITDCDSNSIKSCGFISTVYKLTHLSASNSSASLIKFIVQNNSLKSIILDNLSFDTVGVFLISVGTSKCAVNLTRIDFQYNHSKTTSANTTNIDDAFILLVTKCPNLTRLSLPHFSITDNSLEAIQKHCKEIEYLNIEDCTQISSDGLTDLISNSCHKLKRFSNKSLIPGVRDDGFQSDSDYSSSSDEEEEKDD